jgi:hypothetical protein
MKNINIKYILIYLMLMVISTYSAKAQDTLRTGDFDVIKDFKPILADIIKIPSNPNPEVPEVKAPKLEYTLPSVRLNAPSTIYTIKPLAMGTAVLSKLKSNFFKIGYGNYNSPLLEAYVHTTRNKTSQAGVYIRHFSANPSGKLNRDFSDNSLKLWGKRFLPKGVVNVDVAFNRNVIHLYGFPQTERVVSDNNMRRQYAALDLSAGYSNITKDTSKLRYDLSAHFYNFVDNKKNIENDFQLSGLFTKRLQGNPLQVKIMVHTNTVENEAFNYNRLFIQLNPQYTLSFSNNAYLRLGLNATLFNDSNTTNFFVYPNVEAAIQLIPKALTFYGGLTGNYQPLTNRRVFQENPFTSAWTLANTNNKFEFYAGLRGEISGQTGFSIQAGSAQIQNMMFYALDSTTLGQRILFDTSTIRVTIIKAELNHEFGDKFHLQFILNYTGYNVESVEKPFSMPTFTTRTALLYNIGNKFLLKGDIYTMNKRSMITLPSDKQENLPAFADVNVGLSYKYNKNTGLFIQFNNITNNQYQRWNNFPVFGFNVLAGLTITF